MMRRILILSAVFLVSTPAGHAWAQASALTVDEIVAKANLASYYAGDDGLSDVAMTITDSQGRQRVREFRILRKDITDGGEQRFYVYFQKPADVAKMVYMVWKQLDREDDRWLYLPALDLVRRIAASDKRSSFVGSHFVYEDVSGRSPDADVHELVDDSGEFYKLKNTPKDPAGLEFAYYTVQIRKDNFLPVRAVYYDAQGREIRSIEALRIEDIGGYPTVVSSKAVDLARGGETTMSFSDVRYDAGLGEDIFAERYLRRPPVQWVK